MKKNLLLLIAFLTSVGLHQLYASDDYLCLTAEQLASTVSISKKGFPDAIALEYSKDKETWKSYVINAKITLTNMGEKVYFRAVNKNVTFSKSQSEFYQFDLTGKIAASGNIMSLLDKNCEQTSVPDYGFIKLFGDNLASCLTSAPQLPATEVGKYGYCYMFEYTNLKVAPQLPATSIKDYCYYGMFRSCMLLTQSPDTLPATTLAPYCYTDMFLYCSKLQNAPYLPATDITPDKCYAKMFCACSSLDSISVAFNQWASDNTDDWLYGVVSKGTFTAPCELPKENSASRIPSKWTSSHNVTIDTVAYVCASDLPFIWHGAEAKDGDTWSTLTKGGCDSTEVLHLVVIPVPTVEICPDTVIHRGEQVPLWATGADEYRWAGPGVTSEAPTFYITPTKSAYYNLSAYNHINLVQNGDFEQGARYFRTEYVTTSGGSTANYNVVNNSGGECSLNDHTTGSGRMFLADGATDKRVVWEQTIYVLPNTRYDLSAWAAVWTKPSSDSEKPKLQFYINDVAVGSAIKVDKCEWKQFSTSWNSGTNVKAKITIKDLCTSSSKNDFLLDDIVFTPDITPCPTQERTLVMVWKKGEESANACAEKLPYQWHTGKAFSTSGTYYDTIASSAGFVDSIATLHLTVLPPIKGDTTAFFCEGSSYTWYENTYTEAGNYDRTFTAVSCGCDSVVTLHLFQMPQLQLTVRPDTTIEQGDSARLWATGAQYYKWQSAQPIQQNLDQQFYAVPTQSAEYTVTGYVQIDDPKFNLVKNADFELGNQDFTSSYTYKTNSVEGAATYAIGTNPRTFHYGACNMGDHTTGSGKMMVVNGATGKNVVVWGQDVHVQPHTYYAFSAWVGAWTPTTAAKAQLQFSINGTNLDQPFQSPGACTDDWSQFYTIWYSGEATTASIKIVNTCTVSYGNDFLLDDISMIPLTSCSAEATTLVKVWKYGEESVNACTEKLPYQWHTGKAFSTSGTYYDTIASSTGFVDSIATLHLTVLPPIKGDTTAFFCEGSSYTWYENTYTEAGNYERTFTAVSCGCDSVVTLHLFPISLPQLTIRPDTTIEQGDSARLWATGAQYYKWQSTQPIQQNLDQQFYAVPTQSAEYTVTGYVQMDDPKFNLVKNGDFELGNQDFTSSYTYKTNNVIDAATYAIGTNPRTFHYGACNIGDHTTGSGKMMVVNGATGKNVVVWGQDVHVQPHTYYAFSAWVGMWSETTAEKAMLQFSINGTNLDQPFQSPASCNDDWRKFYIVWYSGEATTASIKLVNTCMVSYGNDFLLDDIAMIPLTSCSAEATTLVKVWKYGEESATACTEKLPYQWHTGKAFSTSGTYYDTIASSAGYVDSIATLHLTVLPPIKGDTTAFFCEGSSYTWYENTYTEAGNYERTFTAVSCGCDSVVTLHLFQIPLPQLTIRPDTAIEQGDSALLWATGAQYYKWQSTEPVQQDLDQQFYAVPTQSAEYKVTGYVQVDDPKFNLVKNGDFELGNQDFTSAYTYRTDNVIDAATYAIGTNPKDFHYGACTMGDHTTSSGKMMVINGATGTNVMVWGQDVQVRPHTYYTFSAWVGMWSETTAAKAQLQFSINGTNLDQPFQSPASCNDDWRHFYTVWYSGEATTASIKLVNTCTKANGNDFLLDDIAMIPLSKCASEATTTVKVWKHHEESASICYEDRPYKWQGDTYAFYESGTYFDTIVSSTGYRDSINALHLTVFPELKSDTLAFECDSFVWYGQTLTATGDYEHHLTSVQGCDSLLTLHLTVYPSYHSEETITVCDSFLWQGTTYTTSGDYTRTYPSQFGCDSILELHLTILTSSTGDTTAYVCYGDLPYRWHDLPVQDGSTWTYVNAVGCDSVVTLHLHVSPAPQTIPEYASFCEGDYLNWRGQHITQAGTYYDTTYYYLGDGTQCDSLLHEMHVTVLLPSSGDTAAVACNSFEWYGTTYTQSGDYQHVLVNKAGCDSTLTLHLTVYYTKYYSYEERICEGEVYAFHGQQITAPGQYQAIIPSVEGCDSIIDLTVTQFVWPKNDFQIGEICADDAGVDLVFDHALGEGAYYELKWDALALANGFLPVARTAFAGASIQLPLPTVGEYEYTVPNTYTGELVLSNDVCDQDRTYPVSFTVLYPSWIIRQKWDDVLGVMNKAYNGGFQFTAYQWYYNDQPLSVGTTEIICINGGLPSGAYRAKVTRESDGLTFFTCAYDYEAPVQPAAKYVARVTPTVLQSSEQVLTIECNRPTTYRIYDAVGRALDQGTVSEGTTTLTTTKHLTPGVCMVQCESNEGTIITTKVIIK